METGSSGIVTESDLILQDVRLEFPTYLHLLDGFIMYPPAVTRFEHELKKAAAAKVVDVMTADPIVVSDAMPLSDVATLLVDRDVSRVPVIDDEGKLVGIVSKHDIVRALCRGGRVTTRWAWAEVDLGAVATNVRTLKALTAPGTRFMAVVKADGYGHGARSVARAALVGRRGPGSASRRSTKRVALREDGIELRCS